MSFVLAGTMHCGGAPGGTASGTPSTPAGSGSPAGSASPAGSTAPSSAFVGRYQATWSAVATFSAPAGTPQQTSALTGIITVTALDDHDVQMVWQIEGNPPSGTIDFAVSSDGTTATGNATGGSCWMGQLPNGNSQTSCAKTATAAIDGDTLTQPQTGTFNGTTPQGIAYAGTYDGTWTATRIR